MLLRTTILFVSGMFLVSGFSGCSAPTSMQTELARLLRDNHYTMYTPFRTEDRPATIFSIATDTEGRRTPLTLSSANRTFNDRVNIESLYQLKDTTIADKLTARRTFDTSIAVELLSVMINAELAVKYVEEISIDFGTPQRAWILPEERVTEMKNELRESVADTLRYHRDNGQLKNVFFVWETLEVESLRASAKLKKEFIGKLEAEEIELIAKAGFKIKSTSESTFEISFDSPMMIGYKAAWFPNTLLSNAVSESSVEYERVSADLLYELMSGG